MADSREDPRIQVADIAAGLGVFAGRAALDGRLDKAVGEAIRSSNSHSGAMP